MVRDFSDAFFFLISFSVVFPLTEKYLFITLFSIKSLKCVTSSEPLAVRQIVGIFTIFHVYSAEDVNVHFA